MKPQKHKINQNYPSHNNMSNTKNAEIKLENISQIKQSDCKNLIFDIKCKGLSVFDPHLENKLSIIGKNFQLENLFIDFKSLKSKSRVECNGSCMSSKLDNKDYRVGVYDQVKQDISSNLSEIYDKQTKVCKKLITQNIKRRKSNTTCDIIVIERLKNCLRKSTQQKKISNHKACKKIITLNLKYLKQITERIDLTIQMNEQIRLLEENYYLDSSFVMTNENNRSDCCLLGNQSEFKRVKQIIFDKKEKDYKYILEEKFPELSNLAHFKNQLKYYCSWLDSQNNKDAHDFALLLNGSYQKKLKIFDFLNSDKYQSTDSKVYISKISDDSLEIIKTMPYIRRLNAYHKNGSYELKDMSINQKYIDVVNYTPTYQDGMQALKWLYYFRSKNWVNQHLCRLRTGLTESQDYIKYTHDVKFEYDIQKNEQGEVVSNCCSIWKQAWIENGTFYSEHYCSFFIK